MARTINEVRNYLDGLVGQITIDKSNRELDGQCVSLIKNLLEFLGAPNPYAARGHAKSLPDTYVPQGLAKRGSGILNVAVNRNGGQGYGHVWVKIGSDSWQANWAGKPVKKNVGEDPITDIMNLDQWLSGNSNHSNGGRATSLGSKGEALIKEFESLRLTAYDINDGMITIGWGHAEPKGNTNLVAGVTTWTREQADRIFREDIKKYEAAVNNYFTRSFNQNQFDAMVSFAYNLGAGIFGDPRSPWDKNASDSYVLESFPNYINKGTPNEAGLRRRRQAEINLYKTPVTGDEGQQQQKGEATMHCIYERPMRDGKPNNDNGNTWGIYYCNGVNCRHLPYDDNVKLLQELYRKNNGREIPRYTQKEWNIHAPWYKRLEEMYPVI